MVTCIETLKRSKRYNTQISEDGGSDRKLMVPQRALSASNVWETRKLNLSYPGPSNCRLLTKSFLRLNLRASLPTPGEINLRRQWQKNSAKFSRAQDRSLSGDNARNLQVACQKTPGRPGESAPNRIRSLSQVNGTCESSPQQAAPADAETIPTTPKRSSSMSAGPRSASPTRDATFTYDFPRAPTNSRSSSATVRDKWRSRDSRVTTQPSGRKETSRTNSNAHGILRTIGNNQHTDQARLSKKTSGWGGGETVLWPETNTAGDRTRTTVRFHQPEFEERCRNSPAANNASDATGTPRPFRKSNFAQRMARTCHPSQHAVRAASQMGIRFPCHEQRLPQRPATALPFRTTAKCSFPHSANRNDNFGISSRIPALGYSRSNFDIGGKYKFVDSSVLQQHIHDSNVTWRVLTWLQSVKPNPKIYYGFETDLDETGNID